MLILMTFLARVTAKFGATLTVLPKKSNVFYFCAARRKSGKPERKDFPSGPAKRVRMGRIEVKGFFDFRRGLAKMALNYHF